MGRVDDGVDLGHGVVMRNDAASLDVGHAALDTFDNFKLALDIGGNRLGSEVGFAAPGAVRQPTERLKMNTLGCFVDGKQLLVEADIMLGDRAW